MKSDLKRGNMMLDVIALGELLIDFTMVNQDDHGYPTLAAHPGGAPCNFLAALSRYGAKTAFIGKVGDDYFGNLLIKTIDEAGILTKGIIQDTSCFTTLAFVTLDEHGNRSFSFARKPGADLQLRETELKLSLIEEARVFHFGTLSLTDEPAREATKMAVAHAKSCGKLITYDPNLRLPLWPSPETAREQILWGLYQSDIVKISDEEVTFLWSCSPEEGAEKLIAEYGAKLAMVTCGSKGCYLKNKYASCHTAAPRVEPVDTTGAGDIFGGSAVSVFLGMNKAPEDLSQEELFTIGRFASAAASLSTEHPGGILSIPSREAVLETIAAQKL